MGVDGCGVPVHGMPLRSMATLFARLAEPERLGDLAPAADRATEAMLAEPYLVGGRHRVDTDVMRDDRGRRGEGGRRGARRAPPSCPSGLGVAVKIDGRGRPRGRRPR